MGSIRVGLASIRVGIASIPVGIAAIPIDLKAIPVVIKAGRTELSPLPTHFSEVCADFKANRAVKPSPQTDSQSRWISLARSASGDFFCRALPALSQSWRAWRYAVDLPRLKLAARRRFIVKPPAVYSRGNALADYRVDHLGAVSVCGRPVDSHVVVCSRRRCHRRLDCA